MTTAHLPSLEAQISTLRTDALLVLSKLSRGKTIEEIIVWSGGWKFTHASIAAALEEIYAALRIEPGDDAARQKKAGELYRFFRESRVWYQPQAEFPDAPPAEEKITEPV